MHTPTFFCHPLVQNQGVFQIFKKLKRTKMTNDHIFRYMSLILYSDAWPDNNHTVGKCCLYGFHGASEKEFPDQPVAISSQYNKGVVGYSVQIVFETIF